MTDLFAPGMTVRVKAGETPGHVRTPYYLRGQTGQVQRLLGTFPNPEDCAVHKSGLPAKRLYQVLFPVHAVFPGQAVAAADDTILADIYEHWLEPATVDAGETTAL